MNTERKPLPPNLMNEGFTPDILEPLAIAQIEENNRLMGLQERRSPTDPPKKPKKIGSGTAV